MMASPALLRRSFVVIRRLKLAALAVLLLFPIALCKAETSEPEKPALIDAVVAVLFPYLQPKAIKKLSDGSANVELQRNFVLSVRQKPDKPCVFQTIKTEESNPVIQQYNFDRLSGYYHVNNDGRTMSSDFFVEGYSAHCIKDNNGLNCSDNFSVTVVGLNSVRRTEMALEYLLSNGCPAMKPKHPF